MKYKQKLLFFFLFCFFIQNTIHAQGWKNLNQIAEGNNLLGVAWADNNTAVAVGTNATILKTTNSGVLWTKIDIGYTRKTIRAIRFLEYSNSSGSHSIGVAVGTMGGWYAANSLSADNEQPIVLLTTDKGDTWISQTTPLNWVNFTSVALCIDPLTTTPKAFIVGPGDKVLVGTNIITATPTWTYMTRPAADAPFNPTIQPELPKDSEGKELICVEFFPGTNPIQGVITGNGGYVLRTNDAGAHWSTLHASLSTDDPAEWVSWSNHKLSLTGVNTHNNPGIEHPLCLSVNANGDCLMGTGSKDWGDGNGVNHCQLIWSSNFGREWLEPANSPSHILSNWKIRNGDITSCYLYSSGNFIFSGHHGRILSSSYTLPQVQGSTTTEYFDLPYSEYTETILEPQVMVTSIAVSPNVENIMAVGWNGNIWRKIGTAQWVNCMDNPTSTITLEGLNCTRFVSSTEGWAVGNKFTVLHATSPDRDTIWNWQHLNLNSVICTDPHDLRADLYSVFFLSTNTNIGWVTGEGGVIFKTTNNGQTWVRQNPGIHNYHLKSIYFRDQQFGWAVGSDNTVLFTNNGGTTWTANPITGTGVTIPPKTIYYSITEANNRTIIVGENISLYTTPPLQDLPNIKTWALSTVTFQQSKDHDSRFYTVDGDETTGANTSDTPINPRFWLRSVKQLTSGIMYAVGYMYNGLSKNSLSSGGGYNPSLGLILYSIDNGEHWTEQFLNNNTYSAYSFFERIIPQALFDITFEGNQAWAVGGNGYIIHTQNANAGTSPLGTGAAGTVWGSASITAGTPKEQNSHTQWSLISASYISGTGTSARLIAVGDRGTILRTTQYGSLGKAVQNEDAPIQTGNPVNLDSPKLFQNVPNPFSQSTTISFRIPNTSHVNLSIVDGLGRTISVLTDGIVESGEHSVSYEPIKISSGVYYCRLNVDGYIEIKPMMVVR